MKKATAADKKLLKDLTTQIKSLQIKLAQAKKLEGIDPYIEVKVRQNQARFDVVKQKNGERKTVAKFFMAIEIVAEQSAVFVPLSIASGKKVAGFMYQIEGTAEGEIETAEVRVQGKGVSQVTVGTLLYAKIPVGVTASFRVFVNIRGREGKEYKIVITRLNYKLAVADARYQQYLKELPSDTVKL